MCSGSSNCLRLFVAWCSTLRTQPAPQQALRGRLAAAPCCGRGAAAAAAVAAVQAPLGGQPELSPRTHLLRKVEPRLARRLCKRQGLHLVLHHVQRVHARPGHAAAKIITGEVVGVMARPVPWSRMCEMMCRTNTRPNSHATAAYTTVAAARSSHLMQHAGAQAASRQMACSVPHSQAAPPSPNRGALPAAQVMSLSLLTSPIAPTHSPSHAARKDLCGRRCVLGVDVARAACCPALHPAASARSGACVALTVGNSRASPTGPTPLLTLPPTGQLRQAGGCCAAPLPSTLPFHPDPPIHPPPSLFP